MVFSSPFFLFVFLPLVLLLVCITPKKAHNFILLIASIFFYSWGSVSHTFLFIISMIINYFFGLAIDKYRGERTKWILSSAVAINLLLLAYFKYFNFLVENINLLLFQSDSSGFENAKIALPIGISFYTFHALSYIIDVYRGKVPAQKNFLDLALYISFFPQLIAGPIVRYIDVAEQFQHRTITLDKISGGIQRFIFGFAKKVIVANSMAYVADQIFNTPVEHISSGAAWLGAIAYTFQIYFDFSGYSDMAIGLARIFGFVFPENFNYPYSAQSIKEFWRRWHISLSTWFRDFLYIPLGGNNGSEARVILNLLIVFFCTGFWHGASWNFVVWGMYHGTFLLIERLGFDNVLNRIGRPLRTIYTLLVVVVGWVFFRADTLTQAIEYLGRMGLAPSAAQIQVFAAEFIDTKFLLLAIFATLYSFRIFRILSEKMESYSRSKGMENAFLLGFFSSKFIISTLLFGVTITYLAASTYNPFIYFRF